MPKNLSSAIQTGPLSVGNVVSASLRIYRDHFKSYFGLALTAYLWLLVPIYGWAKYSAISALISRLAFGEVSEHPETVSDARSQVNPRMWSFFGAGILTSLILSGVYLAGAIAIGILAGGAAAISQQNYLIIGALVVVAVIALLIIYIRIFSQLFIVELPLAIENNLTASSAISRSWELTKGSVGRIMWIVFVGILVSIPVSTFIQIVMAIVQAVLAALLGAESSAFLSAYIISIVALSLVSGALVHPFWQAMKAIIYYDLRSRKEGLGLQMRDAKRK
ncbi:MAG: glycerophosphoryl diester phosphodiesterase membrane domain-containing protein [Microcoleus sp. CAN_BIN18]|nr:glycerophosphoryl diester phosphodiesterase membrane domain-containing protein [Microcoleus sp. CAN_BIN18]